MIEKFDRLINLIFTNLMRHIFYSLKSNRAVRYKRRTNIANSILCESMGSRPKLKKGAL